MVNCLITAGPTYESLDQVRRLTNFSTGKLGSTLAEFLIAHGHQVRLLLGEMATYPAPIASVAVERFSTTQDLLSRFASHANSPIDAIFHAAAVSDFTFGKTWERLPSGALEPVQGGKLSTRHGTLMTELIPTPKIIAQLRQLFPQAKLVGWKYEVDGDTAQVVERAQRQIAENHTDICVANGPAFGVGFGWVSRDGLQEKLSGSPQLFERIDRFLREHRNVA